ncbi:MAG: TonB-dependent receptor [Bacteroidota bacterium]
MRLLRFLPLTALFIGLPVLGQENNRDSLIHVVLEEVVVTAKRGGGEILKVPMAVGVVDARDFMHSRRVGLNEALWGMPGVFAQSRGGGSDIRLTVRGFGARGNGDRSNAATIRGIKVLVDGFPETEPDGRTSLDLVDLSAAHRIEVIRSNASTLFGNASGGVINIETHSSFTEPFVESNNLMGDFGLRKHNLRLGLPFGKNRLSISGTNMQFDGWRRQTASSSTQFHAAFVSEIDPDTRLRLQLSAVRSKFDIPGPLTEAQYLDDPSQANSTYAARRERRDNTIGRLAVSLTKTLSSSHLIEAMAYVTPKLLQRSERNTFRDFARAHVGGGAVYNWSPQGTSLMPKLVIGVDESYQDGTALFYNLRNGEQGDSLRTNKSEGANSFGAFIQGQLAPLDRVTLTAGLRYDIQTYISRVFPAGENRRSLNERLSMNHLTPTIAIMVELGMNHVVYLNYGGGVEAPAFNETDPPSSLPNAELNPFLKPMSSSTVEIGLKHVMDLSPGSFLSSLSYTLAAYVITIRDEIVPYDGGLWYFSAGKSRRTGLEVGTLVELKGRISLKGALTSLHSEYVEYTNELGSFAGRDVPGIPPVVLNLRARYTPIAPLSLELGLEHVGSYYSDDANKFDVPSYSLLHAAASYTNRFGATRFGAFLGVNNFTDRKHASSAFINPVTSSIAQLSFPAYLEPGLPRNFFAGIDLKFDL